jgi:acetyl-CoA synthetase
MKAIYPVKPQFKNNTLCDQETYQKMYKKSVDNNEAFWAAQGKRLDWFKDYTQVKDVSFDKQDLHIKWYADGELNVSYNCIDRHLKHKANQTAIIWEGDDPNVSEHITYSKLHDEVCRMANTLKKLGVVKGDRVTLYMPMIPEAAYAMLACARIGAVHSIVFGGFSPDALGDRIINCKSKVVITADRGVRGSKSIPLKKNVDLASMKKGVKDY